MGVKLSEESCDDKLLRAVDVLNEAADQADQHCEEIRDVAGQVNTIRARRQDDIEAVNEPGGDRDE